MKISFDFDDTLEKQTIQKIATMYINSGDEVYIITRRCADDSADVLSVADRLGIPHSNIFFTCGEFKYKTIQGLGIDLHFDDKFIETALIEKNTNTKAILIQ